MSRFYLRVMAVLLVIALTGCGDRANQVVESPALTPEEQAKAYDDYDRQAAESVPNP